MHTSVRHSLRSDRSGRFVSEKPKLPKPGQVVKAKYRRTPRQRHVFTCEVCGEQRTAYRKTKRFCSDYCRKRAHDERHAGAAEMAGIEGNQLRIYRLLQQSRPEIAQACEDFYAVFGKRAAGFMLDILYAIKTGGQQKQDTRTVSRSILARLGGKL